MHLLRTAALSTLAAALILASAAYAQGAAPAPAAAGCTACHAGIESIGQGPVMSQLSCVECHQGNASAAGKDDAHRGMWANPSDLRVADRACGGCHGDDVANASRSLHATMAGMISGTRYAWGAQDTRGALYATYPVKDEKPGTAASKRGAVRELAQLPSYDPAKPASAKNSPADDYLREQCLRCHTWSQGGRQDGDYRASGCAACHAVYSDAGTYEGADKAIDRKQKGRPRLHRLTKLVPESQCIHCHNRGGRTGVSFIGEMESDGYGSPWGTEAGKKGGATLHGKTYNHLTSDVHYEKGMSCIDCHTRRDLHGDGRLYQKREQAVEVRCEDCHGTARADSKLVTSWGNPLDNLKRGPKGVTLVTRLGGKELPVQQTREVMRRGSREARAAMGIAAHMNRMECYSCHAKWAPQCYGCHAQQDTATRSGDWITGSATADPSKGGTMEAKQQVASKWQETRSYLRWESPVLGINARGKVSPFVPGCQVIFTQLGADGKPVVHNKTFTTFDGLSGISSVPLQPHTISKAARTCEDCHANRKALGLGTGVYDAKKNGVDLPFELERIVDENGKQLQASGRDGARPFNKEELERIQRVNSCLGCHDAQADAAKWKKVTDVTGFARTDPAHRKLLKKALEKASR